MPRPFTADELVGADLVWLLDLTFGSQVYRFSNRTIEVTDSTNGTTYLYRGALEPTEVVQGFDLLDDSPIETEAEIEIAWPGDIAKIHAAGHRLGAGTAELSLLIVGTDYDDRYRQIYNGRVIAPRWGEAGAPVTFTLRASMRDDRALIPDDDHKVTSTTWPDSPRDSRGAVYPIVIGEPGTYLDEDNTAVEVYATPAIVVDVSTNYATKLLIAGHAVLAGTVKIKNVTQGIEYDTVHDDFDVTIETDGLGNTVSTIDLTLPNTSPPVSSAARLKEDEYAVCWHNGGGLSNDFGDLLTYSGDVTKHMLRLSTLTVDEGRTAVAAEQMRDIRLDGYIDEQVSPWEWLQDNVIPIVAASITSQGRGVYPLPWHLDATASDAVADLTEGANFSRQSDIEETDDDDVINRAVLQFALDEEDDYCRAIAVSSVSEDPDNYAIVSENRYGRRSQTIESDFLYDVGSARNAARKIMRANAFTRLLVDYDANTSWAWLAPGDIVTMTDAGLHWTSRVGVIVARKLTIESVGFTIAYVDDHVRDSIT